MASTAAKAFGLDTGTAYAKPAPSHRKELTEVGPGTPMGELFRRYWLPVALSQELAGPDCPPVRIRLLGENLIAFRTTSGDVGLI